MADEETKEEIEAEPLCENHAAKACKDGDSYWKDCNGQLDGQDRRLRRLRL